MKTFLTNEEEQSVVEQIRQVETRTSGEVRVAITSRWIFRTERYAWKMFHKLGMSRTSARNGALIVVIQRRRRFVILGDTAISAFVGPGYWEMIATTMSDHLKNGERLAALIAGIRLLGETLSTHWPPEDTNPNELSNDIAQD